MGFLSKTLGLLKLSFAALKSEVPFGEFVAVAMKYGPLIAAVIEAIEKNKSDEEAQIAATQWERAFRVLLETKNPKPLQDAIMAHCNSDNGCMLP